MANKRTLELVGDLEDQWRWRLFGGNGEIVAWGESYTTKPTAKRGAISAGVAVRIIAADGIFEYYNKDGVLTEGWYKEREISDELATQPLIPDNGSGENAPVTLDQLKTASTVVSMIGAGLTTLSDGHFVLNSHVYHPKHPDADQCAIPFCQMRMIVDGDVVQVDGSKYVG